METIEEHDVRVLVPIERHKKLNKMFDELPAGESFIFINDHDPKPLYYEFRSIHGDVVGWEYLHRGGRDWKVKVTRTAASVGRDMTGVSTLLDLRKADPKDWKYSVFHRYGMMEQGDTMELIAAQHPNEIEGIFEKKFKGKYHWQYTKQEPGEVVVHLTKRQESDPGAENIPVFNEFDVRPYPPAKRHEMVFDAFDQLKPGEAFVFINDHDPKPLYYQIEAESQEDFKWEYLQKGEEAWKVKVSKEKSS